jgi:hypothetical protein
MGYRYRYSGSVSPLLEPTEMELAQEQQDNLNKKKEEDLELTLTKPETLPIMTEEELSPDKSSWVPLSPESSAKLQKALEEQKSQWGVTRYLNQPEGVFNKFAAPIIKKHVQSSLEGLKQDPLGLTYYDAGHMPGSTTPEPEKVTTPDNPDEWFDPKTGRVNYGAFRASGLPQAVKRDIDTDILTKVLRMPRQPIEEGQPQIPKSTDSGIAWLAKKVWQVVDGIAGQLPTSSLLSILDYATGKAESYKPEEILTPEERTTITSAHNTGKVKQLKLGLYHTVVNPKETLEDNLRKASAEKVRLAWDMLKEDVDTALNQDVGLATPGLTALKAVKPVQKALAAAKLTKAIDMVEVVANPLASVVKPETTAGRIGIAAAEGAALQPVPMSHERMLDQPTARIAGAALGAGIGSVAEIVAQGVGQLIEARQIEKHLARVNKIDRIEMAHPDLEKVIDGSAQLDVPIDDIDQQMIVDRALLKKVGVTTQSDGREIAEVLTRGTKDPVVRQMLDTQMALLGTSVSHEKNKMDLMSALREVRDSSEIPNASNIIKELELVVGKDGTPSQGADPYLVNSLGGNSESFRAAVSEAYPELTGILEKVSGRTTDDMAYTLQFNRMVRQVFPNTPKDIKAETIRDARNPDILEAHQHWMEAEIGDVEKVRKQVIAAGKEKKKLEILGTDINSVIDHIRESYIKPREFSPSTVAEVSRAATRKFSPERLEAAKHASEKLYRTVERAMESGTPIDADFIKDVRRQFGGTIHAEILDGLEGKVFQYNHQQQKLAQKSRSIYTGIAKRTFVESERQRTRVDSQAEIDLNEIYSSRDNIDTRLMERFFKPMRDANLPIEHINNVFERIPAVAEAMKAGEVIPAPIMDQIAETTRAIITAKQEIAKPPKYVKLVREFNSSLILYNKQVRALKMVEDRALAALDDLTQAPQTMVMLNRLGGVINNPLLLDKLEVVQAIAAHSIGKLFTNLDLPENSKLNMLHALIGDTATKLRMYGSGAFGFQTHSHMLNVFETSKYLTRETLNRIDEITSSAIGYPMDREFLMGTYLNPQNLHGKDNLLVEMGLDPSRTKAMAEYWTHKKARSEARFYGLMGPGYISSKIAADSLLPLIQEANLLQTTLRESGMHFEKNYLNEIMEIARFRELHPSPGFSLGFYKLNGSKGMFDFFYTTDYTKGFKKTPLGEAHYEMFVTRNEETRQALMNHDREAFTQLFIDTGIEPDAGLAKATAEHLYNYFDDERIWGIPEISWENIWKFAEESSNLRLRAHKDVENIVLEANERYARYGFSLPIPEWRGTYVYRPSKAHNINLDEFESTLYRDFNGGRYFHSSEDGQLAKANSIDLGYNGSGYEVDLLQDPILDLLQYVKGDIGNAFSSHVRLKIEENGALLKDMGFSVAADWLFKMSRDMFGAGDRNKTFAGLNRLVSRTLLSAPPGMRTALLALRPVASVLLRTSKSTWQLARASSLVWNAMQQHVQTALMSGKRPDVALARGLESAYRGTTGLLKDMERPSMSLSEPMSRSVIRVMQGLQDASGRDQINLLVALLETSRKTRERAKATPGTAFAFGIAKKEAGMVDVIIRNFKERNEAALSRAQIEIGARTYESMIKTIEEEGPQKAYSYLADALPEAQRANLWEFVRNAEEGLSKGNPYTGMEDDFLHFWNAQYTGRFGVLAVPAFVRSMATVLPQTYRFFAPRTNNLFRYLDTLTETGERGMDMWMARSEEHPQWKSVPKSQRALAGYTLLYGGAFMLTLQALNSGLGFMMGSELVKQIRANDQDNLKRRIVEGFGIDLRRISPIDYSNPMSLAQGYITTRSGMIPIEVANALESANIILKNAQDMFDPESGVMETELSKLDDARKQYIPGSPSADHDKWKEANGKYKDAVEKYRNTTGIRFVDYVLESFAPTAILPIVNDPLMTSLTLTELPNLRIQSIQGSEEWRGAVTDVYNLVSGERNERLPRLNETDMAVLREYYRESGMSEERINFQLEYMKKFRDMLVDADEVSNYLNRLEHKRDVTAPVRKATRETGTIYPRPVTETIDITNPKSFREQLSDKLKQESKKSK